MCIYLVMYMSIFWNNCTYTLLQKKTWLRDKNVGEHELDVSKNMGRFVCGKNNLLNKLTEKL